MRYVTWPEGVPPCLMPLSPEGGVQDNRLSFETDYGLDISRPRASWSPEIYDVEIAPMSRTQFKTFSAWFRNDLAWGSHAFIMDHPLTGEPAAWRPVPGDQPYHARKIRLMPKGEGVRGISVSMQIRSVPLTSDFWDIVNA